MAVRPRLRMLRTAVAVAAVASCAAAAASGDGSGDWPPGRVLPRPGLYFGTTTHEAAPVLTGLAWAPAAGGVPEGGALRHAASHGHGLQRWGWAAHDGGAYGLQPIGDAAGAGANLTVEFLQPETGGGAEGAARPMPPACQPWAAVVNVTRAGPPPRRRADGSRPPAPLVAVYVYVAVEGGVVGVETAQAAAASAGGDDDGGGGVTVVVARGSRPGRGEGDVHRRFTLTVSGGGAAAAGAASHGAAPRPPTAALAVRTHLTPLDALVAGGGGSAGATASDAKWPPPPAAVAAALASPAAGLLAPRVLGLALPAEGPGDVGGV